MGIIISSLPLLAFGVPLLEALFIQLCEAISTTPKT